MIPRATVIAARVAGKSNATKRAVSSLATRAAAATATGGNVSQPARPAGARGVSSVTRVVRRQQQKLRHQQMSHRNKSDFAAAYEEHVKERAAEGVVPRPLNAEQVASVVELLKDPPADEKESLLDLFVNRVPPGVDEAAYVKAGFLTALVKGEASSPLIDRAYATELLGTMQGGYNVKILVELLDDAELGPIAAKCLSSTLLVFDSFYDVETKHKAGNANATAVMESWAAGEWFSNMGAVPEKMTVTVFKVPGETNTDDLSPAPDAWSRPDIPVHALAMLKIPRPGVENALAQIEEAKAKGFPLA